MANAEDLRSVSQAVTSVSQEMAVVIDDVRKHYILCINLLNCSVVCTSFKRSMYVNVRICM